MVDRLPSLNLLLELVQSERDKQLAHFDALDNKAGIVLAFSGLLITLAPDVSTAFRILGVVAAVVSAALSLSAFWPRRFPVLEPSPLRRYLRAEEGFTRLTVLDTLEDFVNESSVLLREKGRRLGWALRALTVAAAFFAAGIVADAIQG
jgi:hypothetical protein